MRWSKVRKLVKETFADSVRDRVDVNMTNDDAHGTSWQNTCKRGWISVDGSQDAGARWEEAEALASPRGR